MPDSVTAQIAGRGATKAVDTASNGLCVVEASRRDTSEETSSPTGSVLTVLNINGSSTIRLLSIYRSRNEKIDIGIVGAEYLWYNLTGGARGWERY